MDKELPSLPIENFATYEKVTSSKPMITGNVRGEMQFYKIASGKKISEEKARKYKAEQVRTVLEPEKHSILYYINKDNPLGPELPNYSDPMFKRWEEALNQDFQNVLPLVPPK